MALFFKKKKVEEPENEILSIRNIRTGCSAANSDEAIVSVGNMLLDAGFISEGYIQGMLNRDHSLTTYIGNDIAIPHGEYEVKDCVKKTGLAIQIYPDGIEWAGSRVRIVIGIASTTDEHVTILQNIAERLGDMDVVEKVVAGDPALIHRIMTAEAA
ncbi:PTS sugar transporter subunit IIA [Allobaculum mucilyticum]|uniref:PTS sugar transporter subunit IIA n=1 Tax=Allobaculum mucilyticum TaxID=2834459 RepID=UPI001E634290|nr:PTS sugar transporter subunit IIA [Allobaculum mucilyticum]UNT97265.1 PTS sugar transporter subunit IIA [Allobaculum mucilyticum]